MKRDKRKTKRHLRAIAGGASTPPVLEFEIDDLTPEGVKRAFVVRFGPRCASWLVFKGDGGRLHAQIRRYGAFALHLAKGEEEPPWFRIAIEYLRTRAKKWSVVVETTGGTRHYLVVWEGGRRRPLPDVLRRN
jgi:hypothetical protein